MSNHRIELQQNAPKVVQAFIGIEKILASAEIEPGLHHLVQLRASQINGCAFCVDMHTRDARKDGETNERLDRLVIWREVDDFSARERAALAWTEALTQLNGSGALEELHGELTRHFSESEIAELTSRIAMINVWNRLQVAEHGGRRFPPAA